MFCSTSVVNTNIIPFPAPIIVIIDAIEYPKQKPLYNIIPNTIGIPITVVPKNHNIIASTIFCIIVVFNNVDVSKF